MELAFPQSNIYLSRMADTYNIKEAQAGLPKLCRSGKRFVIANRNTPVMVALPIEDFEALMETLDVLGDPVAMENLDMAREGKATYRKLDLDDPDFGL
jgi:PHD/YefM family antitoxin component YafN of YafNO toxin-antitoxin module